MSAQIFGTSYEWGYWSSLRTAQLFTRADASPALAGRRERLVRVSADGALKVQVSLS